MRNLFFAFLIGLLVGQAGEYYFRLKLEKDFIVKWNGASLIINPTNNEMILCIQNDCRKVKHWSQ